MEIGKYPQNGEGTGGEGIPRNEGQRFGYEVGRQPKQRSSPKLRSGETGGKGFSGKLEKIFKVARFIIAILCGQRPSGLKKEEKRQAGEKSKSKSSESHRHKDSQVRGKPRLAKRRR